jgi:hypothetical protein
VTELSATSPTSVLADPVLLPVSASSPIAVLEKPDVFDKSANLPPPLPRAFLFKRASSLSVKWPPRKGVLEICGRDRALPVGPLDVHLMHHRLPGRTVWMVRTRGVCAASPSLIWVHELQESPAT